MCGKKLIWRQPIDQTVVDRAVNIATRAAPWDKN